MPLLFPTTTTSMSDSTSTSAGGASSLSTSIPTTTADYTTSTRKFRFPPPSSRPTQAADMQMPSMDAIHPQTAGIFMTRSSLTLSVPTSISALATAVMLPDAMPDSPDAMSTAFTSVMAPFATQSQQAAASGAPLMFAPHEGTIMSKGARIAAIVLGIFGLLALILGMVVCLTRRRRRAKEIKRGLEEDAIFDPRSTKFLGTPEPYMKPSMTSLNQVNTNIANTAHMTRSTERSNTLFGPGPYIRPETVTTERKNFPTPPTPNPFNDPQRNKAYDVLGGRPRSTTLTDRGSWVKNPFRDPESERFDPFGELHEKAKKERTKQMNKQLDDQRREAELVREYQEVERARNIGARQAAEALREAELVREYEEMERAFEAKEAMGLAPEGVKIQGRR